MAVDLTISPWNRLAKLAPPGTPADGLEDAADRYALTADIYAAAADLWEESAFAVDMTPDPPVGGGEPTGAIKSVSQDGISVTYVDSGISGLAARQSQRAQLLANARRLRAQSKAKSPLVHDPDYNPFSNTTDDCDDETVIVVDEV